MKYLIFALRTGFLSLTLALVASCGGGGGGSSTGTAPVISSLTVTPPAAYVSAATLNFDAAFDFADADGNVASFTMRTLDSQGVTTDLQTQAIQGISGVTAGTIFVQLMATSVPADTYTVELYITDAVGQRSNTLSRAVRIAEYPWTSKLAGPTLREYAASVAYGGKVYVMGGQLPHTGVTPGPATNVLEIYDVATNTWTTGNPMPTARMGLVAAVANNKIYAIGGCTDGYTTSAVGTVEEYDPGTGLWSAVLKSPMSVRCYAGGAALPTGTGDHIVVAGGESAGTLLDTVEEYNPLSGASGAWVTRMSLPRPRKELAMAESGGRLYAVGGYAGLTTQWVATVEEFDPGTSQWTARANMPTARSQIALVTVNGKLLAAGGGNVNPSLNVLESYDPVTNTWTTKTPSTRAFTRATASVVNGKMYVFGDGITLEYNPANEIY